MRDRRPEPRRHQAALRVTDFDRAVLAAAKIGALTQRTVATRMAGPHTVEIKAWYMGTIRVDASIKRLDRAGELIQRGGNDIALYFPGDTKFEAITRLRERLRNFHKQPKETK